MSLSSEATYDVAVVGGGVVGCAVLNELSSHGYRSILLEKENALLTGASAGNSGIAHIQTVGMPLDLYHGPGTLEDRCVTYGCSKLFEVCHRLNVPCIKKGALIVAWTQQELVKLSTILLELIEKGAHDARLLTALELMEVEPNISTRALGAVFLPSEAVLDSWKLPASLAHESRRFGAEVKTGFRVEKGHKQQDGTWLLHSPHGSVKAHVVINAAGLHGDSVEEICRASPFRISPRKGQFVVFGKEAGKLLRHIIYPVPTEKTRGILVFTSVYGNLVVGPTAEESIEREKPTINSEIINQLIAHGRRLIPTLKDHPALTTYAGLRPATQFTDYQIEALGDRNWITVGGIRSTGVSSCLGISKYVRQLLETECHIPIPPINKSYGEDFNISFNKSDITHPLFKIGQPVSKAHL